jgi:hypothetical protein
LFLLPLPLLLVFFFFGCRGSVVPKALNLPTRPEINRYTISLDSKIWKQLGIKEKWTTTS